MGLEELKTKLMTEEEGMVSKSRILENEVMNKGRIAHDGSRNLYGKESRADQKRYRNHLQSAKGVTFKTSKHSSQSTLFLGSKMAT